MAFDPAKSSARAELDVSVIVPLIRHRGRPVPAVRSWLDQDYPRERFEVIVVSDGREPALDRTVQGLLTGRDQHVVAADASEQELLRLGAARARGRVLVFTEGHCEARPTALSVVLVRLAAGDLDALALGIEPRWRNAVGWGEVQLIAKRPNRTAGLAAFHVLPEAGCAIPRERYVAAGGIRPELSIFALPVLALELHKRGARLGSSGSVDIVHHNSTWLGEVRDGLGQYGRGQCLFRAERPADYARYFGTLPEWRHRGGASARSARAAWSACLSLLVRGGAGPTRRRAARALLTLAPAAALGTRFPATAYAAGLAAATLRCRLWNRPGPRFERAFFDFCAHAIGRARTRLLQVQRDAAPPSVLGVGRVSADDIADAQGFSFHPVEVYGRERFCWSRPIVSLPLRLAPGRYRVVFEKRGLRSDLDARDITAALDGRALPRGALTVGLDAVALDIAVAGGRVRDRRLLLLCTPLAALGSADPRRLGLPVFSLSVAPVAAAGAAGSDEARAPVSAAT